MNKKLMLLLSCMLWGDVQAASQTWSIDEDSEDQEEFFDAQEEQPVAKNEFVPWQQRMQEYPLIDKYTGYSKHLDEERVKIINELMYCFIYSSTNGKEHSKYQALIKKYNRIQKERELFAAKVEEKKQAHASSPRTPRTPQSHMSSSSSSPHRKKVENDSEDDFGDYESMASQEKRNGSEEKLSHGMSSPEEKSMHSSERSFDW